MNANILFNNDDFDYLPVTVVDSWPIVSRGEPDLQDGFCLVLDVFGMEIEVVITIDDVLQMNALYNEVAGLPAPRTVVMEVCRCRECNEAILEELS